MRNTQNVTTIFGNVTSTGANSLAFTNNQVVNQQIQSQALQPIAPQQQQQQQLTTATLTTQTNDKIYQQQNANTVTMATGVLNSKATTQRPGNGTSNTAEIL